MREGRAAGLRRHGEVPGRSALARLILFYEYFHGDNGAGLGASHQTGWTGSGRALIHLFGRVDGRRRCWRAGAGELTGWCREQVSR